LHVTVERAHLGR